MSGRSLFHGSFVRRWTLVFQGEAVLLVPSSSSHSPSLAHLLTDAWGQPHPCPRAQARATLGWQPQLGFMRSRGTGFLFSSQNGWLPVERGLPDGGLGMCVRRGSSPDGGGTGKTQRELKALSALEAPGSASRPPEAPPASPCPGFCPAARRGLVPLLPHGCYSLIHVGVVRTRLLALLPSGLVASAGS